MNGRVDGRAEGREKTDGRAFEAASQEEDDDDCRHPEQRLDDPRRPFPGPSGRIERGGVEQGRTRGPVAGVMEGRPTEAPFLIQRLGERVVGVRVGAGCRQRLGDPVGPQPEGEDEDQAEDEKGAAPVSLG